MEELKIQKRKVQIISHVNKNGKLSKILPL